MTDLPGAPTFLTSEWLGRVKFDRPAVDLSRSIASPISVLEIEQARGMFLRNDKSCELKTDLFVLSIGEPPMPYWSKIGGTPFRPKDAVWPEYEPTFPEDRKYKGGPLTFLAQFYFGDSLDITPALPGDLMLVFAYPELQHIPDDPNIVTEWYYVQDIVDSCAEVDCYPPAWPFLTAFGNRFRTCDYSRDVCNSELPVRIDRRSLHVYHGFKISGYPMTAQWPSPRRRSVVEGVPRGAEYLCSLCSVGPDWYRPWPFVNQKHGLSSSDSMTMEHQLNIGYDFGGIDFYIDEEGEVYNCVSFEL